MSEEIVFTTEEFPAERDCIHVRTMLRDFNQRKSVDDQQRTLAVFAKTKGDKILGGLLGGTYWGWMQVDYLWISEEARRQGIGTRLLRLAETEAVKRKCRSAHLETHDFQAPAFYERNGYEVFACLEDLPPGHRKIFLESACCDRDVGCAASPGWQTGGPCCRGIASVH